MTKFTAITRWGRLEQVREGLAAAKAARRAGLLAVLAQKQAELAHMQAQTAAEQRLLPLIL